MTFLIGLFSSFLKLPNWVKGVAVVALLFGATEARHAWIDRGLHKQISSLQQQLKDEKADAAQLKVDVAEVTANRDRIELLLKQQSSDIQHLKDVTATLSAQASTSALRILKLGQQRQNDLRNDRKPTNPEELNKWLQNHR